MNKKHRLITAHPAVIAVWAALMGAASLLPSFPIIGTGATFNIGNCFIPLAGIFFGPWAGAIAAGIGAFIGQLLAPYTVLFGPFQFIIAVMGAMVSGLAMQKKWIWSLLTLIGLTLVWYAVPAGRAAWATPILYLLGFAGIFVGWLFGKDWLTSPKRGKMFSGILCISLAGIVTTQAIGNLWALLFFKLPPLIWYTTLPIAPIERFTFSLGAAVIGTPLLIGLPKISIPVGPMLYDDEEEDEDDKDKEEPKAAAG